MREICVDLSTYEAKAELLVEVGKGEKVHEHGGKLNKAVRKAREDVAEDVADGAATNEASSKDGVAEHDDDDDGGAHHVQAPVREVRVLREVKREETLEAIIRLQ